MTHQIAKGKLTAVDNQIDLTSGTYRLKATFGNEDNSLFPNQMVNVRLLVNALHDVVLVPTVAIQRSPTETFVYVIKLDDTVEERAVEIGPPEGGWTQIVNGVAAGDRIVTEGLDQLKDGSKVTVQEAAARGAASQAGRAGKRSKRSATQGSPGAATQESVEPSTQRQGAAGDGT
jgi:multidrug efflux system membrane fusion protein